MKIRKKYHFYAAHRNPNGGPKCGRIHGHTYDLEIVLHFKNFSQGISMLFSEIDKQIEPIVKFYDHYLILDQEDPLCNALDALNEPYLKVPFETSAENLSIWLYNRIMIETGLPICEISLAETKSSIITYNG